jgi:hypothetical protein
MEVFFNCSLCGSGTYGRSPARPGCWRCRDSGRKQAEISHWEDIEFPMSRLAVRRRIEEERLLRGEQPIDEYYAESVVRSVP